MATDFSGISDDDWWESDYFDAEDYANVHGTSNVGDFSWGGQDMWNTSPAQSNDMHGLLGGGFNEYDGTTGENVFGGNQDLLQVLTPVEQAYKNVVNRNNKSRNRLAQRFNQNNTIKNVDVTSPLTQVGNAFGTFGDNILKYNEIAGKGLIDIGKSVPAAYARGAGNLVKQGKSLLNIASGTEYFDENDPEFHQPQMDYNYPAVGKTAEVLGSYLGGATGGVKLAQGLGLNHLGQYGGAILGGAHTTDPLEDNMSNWVEGTWAKNPLTDTLKNPGLTAESSSSEKYLQTLRNAVEEAIVSGPADYVINKYLQSRKATATTPKDDIAGLLDVERTGDRLGILGDEKPTPQMSLIPDTSQKLSDGRYIYNARMYEPNMSRATPPSFPEGGAYGHRSGSSVYDRPDLTKQNKGILGKGHYLFLDEQTAKNYPGAYETRWQYTDDYKERTIHYGVAEQSETVKNAFANISKKYDFEVTSDKVFGKDTVFYDDMYIKLSDKFGEREAQDMLRAEGVIGNRGKIGQGANDGSTVSIYHPDDVRKVVSAEHRIDIKSDKAEQKALTAERRAEVELNKPQAERNELNLFSVLEEKLLRLPQETNLSADVKAYLNKQGVKTNELEDTGLLAYLDENKTVTKTGLLDHFGANKTEIDEVTLGKNVSQHDKDMYNAAADSLRLTRPQDFPTNATVATRHPEATTNETATFIAKLGLNELPELNKYLNAPMASTTQALHEMVEEAVRKGTLDALPDSVMNKVKSAATDMFDARYAANPMYEWHVGRTDTKYVVTGNEQQGYVVRGPDEFVSYTPNTLHQAEIVINGHATQNNYFPDLGDPTKHTGFQGYTTPNLDEKSYREVYIQSESKGGGPFTEAHITAQNPKIEDNLGHLRLSDKYDVQGNKVLFVEEVQSDWIQKGRVRGHTDEENAAKLVTAIKAEDVSVATVKNAEKAVQKAQIDLANKGSADMDVYHALRDDLDAKLESLATAQDAKREASLTLDEVDLGPVPQAPMKRDGVFNGLAMKRAVEIAREEGYAKVVLTNSKQQLDLYNPMGDGKRALDSEGNVLFEELYVNIYDKKLPSILDKLAKKHGGTTGKTEIVQDEFNLNDPPTTHYSITLTPEFKENIRGGLPLYEAGAIAGLGGLLDSDFNEDSPLLLGEGVDSVTDSLIDAMTRIEESNITTREKTEIVDGLLDYINSNSYNQHYENILNMSDEELKALVAE